MYTRNKPYSPFCGGFTLIELLIVVAIIAILAAIAVPNLLEAQIRAKVSRVKSDLHTVATALEAYRVDHNDYPPNNAVGTTTLGSSILPLQITTPVAYLTSIDMRDPFTAHDVHSDPLIGERIQFYVYHKIVGPETWVKDVANGVPPAWEAIDGEESGLNTGAFDKYGAWKLLSFGPDRQYSDQDLFTDEPLYGSDVLYDPTNGSVSWGNIMRTQKHNE